MSHYRLFTSESVSEGHPDKLCDQVSDAILDAILKEDKNARVACEALAKTGVIIVAGEIRTKAWVDIESIVREVVCKIGYVSSETGFDGNSCAVMNLIGKQSSDIALGVDETNQHELGAGDQGLMFGYACQETDVLMPAPIYYAHKLVRAQSKKRRENLPFLLPDAKSQVTLRYLENGEIESVDTVVLSTQHAKNTQQSQIREAVIEEIIRPTFPKELIKKDTKFFINPTGIFEIGGPLGDCGLTGRKIIVDTYGGYARHGGGAFSGKDPTKVDRSAAYAARHVAKNIVAAGLATYCEVQLAYAIGVAKPVSIFINTFNTGVEKDFLIEKAVKKVFDLSPKGIIKSLNLLHTQYEPVASYGHFGRDDLELPWEKTDQKEALKKALS